MTCYPKFDPVTALDKGISRALPPTKKNVQFESKDKTPDEKHVVDVDEAADSKSTGVTGAMNKRVSKLEGRMDNLCNVTELLTTDLCELRQESSVARFEAKNDMLDIKQALKILSDEDATKAREANTHAQVQAHEKLKLQEKLLLTKLRGENEPQPKNASESESSPCGDVHMTQTAGNKRTKEREVVTFDGDDIASAWMVWRKPDRTHEVRDILVRKASTTMIEGMAKVHVQDKESGAQSWWPETEIFASKEDAAESVERGKRARTAPDQQA